MKRLRRSSQTPEVTQGNLGLTSPPHFPDQHQKQRDKTLDSPSALISFIYINNKKRNTSTTR